jgi:hypothetical protein
VNRRLIERRARLLRQLPPLAGVLRGSLVERVVRCGRANCRCAQGPGHPNVFFSVTLAGGRTEQLSVPAALVGVVREGIATYARWWAILEAVSAINRQLLRAQRTEQRQQRRRRGR